MFNRMKLVCFVLFCQSQTNAHPEHGLKQVRLRKLSAPHSPDKYEYT